MAQANPLAPALAALMNIGDLRRAWLKARSLEGVARAPVDEARQSLLVNIIETYLPLSDTEEREFEELVGREEMAEARAMLTVYDERGRQLGVVEGKQDWLLRTLRLKFGALPAELEARVAALTSEAELDACLERVLRTDSLEKTGL